MEDENPEAVRGLEDCHDDEAEGVDRERADYRLTYDGNLRIELDAALRDLNAQAQRRPGQANVALHDAQLVLLAELAAIVGMDAVIVVGGDDLEAPVPQRAGR